MHFLPLAIIEYHSTSVRSYHTPTVFQILFSELRTPARRTFFVPTVDVSFVVVMAPVDTLAGKTTEGSLAFQKNQTVINVGLTKVG